MKSVAIRLKLNELVDVPHLVSTFLPLDIDIFGR